jgi:hypothetical protein
MKLESAWPTRWSKFGPVHSCQKCGRMVQYVDRRGQNVLEDVAEGGRHHCPHVPGEALPHYLHCHCGVHCIDRHGQRYDLAGNPHKHDIPKPIVPPVPLRPAPTVKVGSLTEGIDV